jgi:hypothetical protein
MRKRIDLLGSVFTKKTISALVVVAIFSVLFNASTVLSAGPGTIDQRGLNPAVETGLGPMPFYHHCGPGADFVKAGVTTRKFTLSGVPPQTEPFVLAVPALPVGAVVVNAFISWNYLLDGVPPAIDTITVNTVPVVGGLCGSGSPDLCWGKEGAASYKVDATGIITGAGPVTIAGATDKPLGTDPMAYGEGLTILVVFNVPGNPCRSVDVWCGYTSNTSAPAAIATLTYTVPYAGGTFHFFTNGLDGQIAPDDFFIDGILRSGAVAGTVAVGDAWQGLLGPSPTGVDNLYDHANDDISVLVPPPGAASLTFSTSIISDCVGHSFAAVSFNADCCPPQIPTLTEWGQIIFGLMLLGFITWVFLKRRKKVIGVRS